MAEIGHVYDFDDQFFRMVTVGLSKTMSKHVRWINRFDQEGNETGLKRVFLPFYTSLTGEENFLLDLFVDDVVDKRVTLNTDQYQRGTITFNGISSKSDEMANPNMYLSKKEIINDNIRKVISKVKAVPITINYDIEIQLATSLEVDKVSQKLLNIFYNYQFYNYDYYGVKIDAFFGLPDDKSIEIQREINMESERKKKITFSLEVQTYYPIFMIDTDDLIVCDNDDMFDWDYIGLTQPTLNYEDSLKKYNESHGQTSYAGSDDDFIEGKTGIRQVYWYNMYREMDQYNKVNKDKKYNPSQWNKEDFDGVEPGESMGKKQQHPNNDIDIDE